MLEDELVGSMLIDCCWQVESGMEWRVQLVVESSIQWLRRSGTISARQNLSTFHPDSDSSELLYLPHAVQAAAAGRGKSVS